MLVVEDDESVRSATRRILQRAGLSVLEAGDAADSPGNPGDLSPEIPFLPKPFSAGELREAVMRVLGDARGT